jgi:D-xylose transport system permease protein
MTATPAAADAARPVVAPSRRLTAGIGSLVGGQALSMLVVFVLLAIAFNIAAHGVFFTPRNMSLLLRQASLVAVLSGGVSVLMVMGEIDLSIGSGVFLCSVIAATLQVTYGFATLPTVLLTLLTGVVLGAWQGLWVVGISVPSFIVTLGGLLAFRGLGLTLTDAATIAPMQRDFIQLSERFIRPDVSYVILALLFVAGVWTIVQRYRAARERGVAVPTRLAARLLGLIMAVGFLAWAFGGFLGIPTSLVWVSGCGILMWVLMMRTKFGRNAYLIGSNRQASVLAGIGLKRHLLGGFLLMGLLYGVGGVLITARLSAATPSTGTYLELDAIAAAVIGGTSLRGGVGTVPGAMTGAVLLATIDNGMSMLNVSSFIQLMVKGMVLLLALAFDAYVVRRRAGRA